MQTQAIVDQLAKIIPNYTSGFSNSVDIIAATVAGDVVSVQTSAPHDLEDTQAVQIAGLLAPVQIDTSSFLRTASQAVFNTIQEHDLTLSQRDKAAGGKKIKISGATEAQFNGEFDLMDVPNRNSLVIAVADSGSTTISGSPIVEDANGALFNGLFPATNLGTDTFDYQIGQSYPLNPVLDGAIAQISLRIAGVLDIQAYLEDMYTDKAPDEDVLIVQLGDVAVSKDRSELTDAPSSSSGEYSFNNTLMQPFSLYIIQATTDDFTGADARDKVEMEYIPAIFHAVARAKFDTGFSYSDYRATFTGHGVFAYSSENGKNRALYAHEVTFEQLVQITGADTVESDATVAMRDVDYALTTDLGTGELSANVNLDQDAEPEP